MAVQNDPLKIDPYTSTVPLVQLPVENARQEQTPPMQGEFGKKGTPELAAGDQILKGFLQGHAVKEQKKYAQAQATIQAADKSTSDAYQQYQEALSSGKDPAMAEAAYKNYTDTFNRAKAAKAQFVIPEKPAKGQKTGAKQKAEGFGGGIKDFLSANPHIVPQIALLTMQPKPPGASPETQASKAEAQRVQQEAAIGDINLQNARDKQNAQKVVGQYASLNAEQIEALPPEQKKELAAAKALLYPPNPRATQREYASPDGKGRDWFVPGQQPEGWQATAGAGGAAKPGTPAFYAEQYAKENGITPDQLTTKDLDYLKAKQAWDSQQSSSSSNTTLRPDPVTGQMVPVTITNSRNKGKAPQPPEGRRDVSAQAQPQEGGLTAPPTPPARRAAGGITSPPQSGNVRIGAPTKLKSAQMAQNTQKVETEKKDRYQKAQDKFDKALAANKKTIPDNPADLAKANAAALAELEQEHKGIEDWYTQQVHAVGGTTQGDKKQEPAPPPGATMAYKDKNGVIQGYAVNGQYVAVGK